MPKNIFVPIQSSIPVARKGGLLWANPPKQNFKPPKLKKQAL